MGTAAAGSALLGTLGVVAPIVGLTAAALFSGKKEVSEEEIEQKKKINDAELELELLQSQLEELEKHAKK